MKIQRELSSIIWFQEYAGRRRVTRSHDCSSVSSPPCGTAHKHHHHSAKLTGEPELDGVSGDRSREPALCRPGFLHFPSGIRQRDLDGFRKRFRSGNEGELVGSAGVLCSFLAHDSGEFQIRCRFQRISAAAHKRSCSMAAPTTPAAPRKVLEPWGVPSGPCHSKNPSWVSIISTIGRSVA